MSHLHPRESVRLHLLYILLSDIIYGRRAEEIARGLQGHSGQPGPKQALHPQCGLLRSGSQRTPPHEATEYAGSDIIIEGQGMPSCAAAGWRGFASICSVVQQSSLASQHRAGGSSRVVLLRFGGTLAYSMG